LLAATRFSSAPIRWHWRLGESADRHPVDLGLDLASISVIGAQSGGLAEIDTPYQPLSVCWADPLPIVSSA
jgi:hypothetical protein